MHSVTISATSPAAATGREAKRLATARRISDRAVELTLRHGLDGWTMEDLAEAAEVSRRTLFNYVSAKVDAIIGPPPVLNPEAVAAFVAGGPHGRLLDDLLVLAHVILDDEDIDAATLPQRRELLTTTPRLLVTVAERFEQVTADLTGHILAREGAQFGAHRARLLVRLMVAAFDACLDEVVQRPDERSISEVYDDAVAEARRLLA